MAQNGRHFIDFGRINQNNKKSKITITLCKLDDNGSIFYNYLLNPQVFFLIVYMIIPKPHSLSITFSV